jgi:hypothetical protein
MKDNIRMVLVLLLGQLRRLPIPASRPGVSILSPIPQVNTLSSFRFHIYVHSAGHELCEERLKRPATRL